MQIHPKFDFDNLPESAWVRLPPGATFDEKLAVSSRLWREMRDKVAATLREENPDWTDRRLAWEVARVMSEGAVDEIPPEFRPAGWND